jgi:hypothetical protein
VEGVPIFENGPSFFLSTEFHCSGYTLACVSPYLQYAIANKLRPYPSIGSVTMKIFNTLQDGRKFCIIEPGERDEHGRKAG